MPMPEHQEPEEVSSNINPIVVDQWLISKGNSDEYLHLAVPQIQDGLQELFSDLFAQAERDADDEVDDDDEEEDEEPSDDE